MIRARVISFDEHRARIAVELDGNVVETNIPVRIDPRDVEQSIRDAARRAADRAYLQTRKAELVASYAAAGYVEKIV